MTGPADEDWRRAERQRAVEEEGLRAPGVASATTCGLWDGSEEICYEPAGHEKENPPRPHVMRGPYGKTAAQQREAEARMTLCQHPVALGPDDENRAGNCVLPRGHDEAFGHIPNLADAAGARDNPSNVAIRHAVESHQPIRLYGVPYVPVEDRRLCDLHYRDQHGHLRRCRLSREHQVGASTQPVWQQHEGGIVAPAGWALADGGEMVETRSGRDEFFDGFLASPAVTEKPVVTVHLPLPVWQLAEVLRSIERELAEPLEQMRGERLVARGLGMTGVNLGLFIEPIPQGERRG